MAGIQYNLAYTKSEEFTATAGQTVFNLSGFIPVAITPMFLVNGVVQENADFTVGAASNTITWLNNPFVLDPGDIITINY